MSNIASPRASVSIASPSSSRSSLDTNASSIRPATTTTTTITASLTNSRRNRAALRDYYKIKSPPTIRQNDAGYIREEDAEKMKIEGGEQVSEIDRDDFNAEAYVQRLLESEDLEGLIKAELGLLSEIKDLDGERKALVYDNYSKLIAAADTIGKMRVNMEHLTPTTSTLEPAFAHIVETATKLGGNNSNTQQPKSSDTLTSIPPSPTAPSMQDISQQTRERETVLWALGTPARLRYLLEKGQKDKAVSDYEEILALLQQWKGVKGVQELQERCESIMAKFDENSQADT